MSVAEPGKPNVEFTADGVLKAAELKIMNLRPGVSKQLVWEEVKVRFLRSYYQLGHQHLFKVY